MGIISLLGTALIKQCKTPYQEIKAIKKHKITIEEMISQTFNVEANSLEEALEIAEHNYKTGKFVLAPGNLACKQICGEDENGDCVDWYEF